VNNRLRAIIGTVTAMVAVAGTLTFAAPASANATCNTRGYTNGRTVGITNSDNGGGAQVVANVCYTKLDNGLFKAAVWYTVKDTKANGAGAAIRMEWNSGEGDIHYDVADPRDWEYDSTEVSGYWGEKTNIKNLWIRACLTNSNSEGHHCSIKV